MEFIANVKKSFKKVNTFSKLDVDVSQMAVQLDIDNDFQNGKMVADEIIVMNYVKPKEPRGSISKLICKKMREERSSSLWDDSKSGGGSEENETYAKANPFTKKKL